MLLGSPLRPKVDGSSDECPQRNPQVEGSLDECPQRNPQGSPLGSHSSLGGETGQPASETHTVLHDRVRHLEHVIDDIVMGHTQELAELHYRLDKQFAERYTLFRRLNDAELSIERLLKCGGAAGSPTLRRCSSEVCTGQQLGLPPDSTTGWFLPFEERYKAVKNEVHVAFNGIQQEIGQQLKDADRIRTLAEDQYPSGGRRQDHPPEDMLTGKDQEAYERLIKWTPPLAARRSVMSLGGAKELGGFPAEPASCGEVLSSDDCLCASSSRACGAMASAAGAGDGAAKRTDDPLLRSSFSEDVGSICSCNSGIVEELARRLVERETATSQKLEVIRHEHSEAFDTMERNFLDWMQLWETEWSVKESALRELILECKGARAD